jgi:gamma-glutamylcyclotransferase
MDKKYYYFAYGSNLDEEQMKFRCPNSKIHNIDIVKGYTLCFPQISANRNYLGVAGIRKSFNDDYIKGVVYELSEEDLKLLDGFEGYYPDDIKNCSYLRTEVISENGLSMFIYLSVKDKGFNYKPSDDYLNIILNNVEKHKLGKDYLIKIKNIADSNPKPGFKLIFKTFIKKYILKIKYFFIKNDN